jgi:hypothetical protein
MAQTVVATLKAGINEYLDRVAGLFGMLCLAVLFAAIDVTHIVGSPGPNCVPVAVLRLGWLGSSQYSW